MSVKIRLTRQGSKKKPFYRIVVTDTESPRDGRFLEIIGHYNPLEDPQKIDFKSDRVAYWIGVGATPTDTVKQLMKKAGISGTGGVDAA